MTGVDDSNVNLNRRPVERLEPRNPYVVSLVWIASVFGAVGWILAGAGGARVNNALVYPENIAEALPLWIVGGALFAAAFVAAVAALLLGGIRWITRSSAAGARAEASNELSSG